MMKKRVKAVLLITICITIAYGTSVFAVTNTVRNNASIVSEHKDRCGCMKEILSRLGITKEEMQAAKKEGRTLFDVAKTKGHSETEVRNIVVEVKSKMIDEKVKSGKLTKEKGEAVKAKIKEKVAKWDGSFKHKKKGKDKFNKA